MKKRKSQPFIEILDLKDGYKQYKDLCRNKHKDWKYYSDWEDHIISKFKNLPDEHINNYRHFLMFNSLIDNHALNLYLPLSVAIISIILSPIVADVSRFGTFMMPIVTVMAVGLFGREYFDYAIKDKFMKDLIDVLNKYEAEKNNNATATTNFSDNMKKDVIH